MEFKVLVQVFAAPTVTWLFLIVVFVPLVLFSLFCCVFGLLFVLIFSLKPCLQILASVCFPQLLLNITQQLTVRIQQVCSFFSCARVSVSLRTTREFLDLAYHTHFPHSSLLTFFRTGFNETFKITTTPLWSSRDLLRVCGARSPTQQILLHCGGGGRGSNMANPEPPKHFLGGAMLLKLKLFCSACAAVVISSSDFATVEVFCSAYSAMAA